MASTTIECGPNISKDSISLNGEDVDFEAGSRFRRVFDVKFQRLNFFYSK